MDPIAFLTIAAAGLGAWWLHRYQRAPERLRLSDPSRYEPDAEVAIHVASHEARSRNHVYLSSLHLLYGLLQDETVAEVIKQTGGDVDALEDRVLAALAAHEVTVETASEASWILGYTVMIAEHTDRRASCTDLWAALAKSDSEGVRLLEAGKVDRTRILFLLIHGGNDPEVATTTGDVNVVLRNDDYTTREFVCDVLQSVFALPEGEATTRMQTTHETGRAVIGRFTSTEARAKIEEVRRLAKAGGFPLWIGVEPI